MAPLCQIYLNFARWNSSFSASILPCFWRLGWLPVDCSGHFFGSCQSICWSFSFCKLFAPIHAQSHHGLFSNSTSLHLNNLHEGQKKLLKTKMHYITSFSFKIHIGILRRPQNFAKSSPYFWLALHKTKVRWRFRKIL